MKKILLMFLLAPLVYAQPAAKKTFPYMDSGLDSAKSALLPCVTPSFYNATDSGKVYVCQNAAWVVAGGGGLPAGGVCDTRSVAGADLGARIVACDILLGGTYDATQQGNLAYNTTPTYGVIRVDSSDVGPITTFPVFISAGHMLSLGPGVYTNALIAARPIFQMANNTTLACDNWSTILQNSSNNANGDPRVIGMAAAYQVIAGVGQSNVPYATGIGITVKGCHFQDSGLGKASTLTATVVLTNCQHCKVLDNWFDGIAVTGVGLIGAFYSGVNCSNYANWLAQYCGNYGDGDEIAGNEFNGTQEAISVINNDNVNIHDNKMRDHAVGAAGYIDLESNGPKDHMQYIEVHSNIFDCSTPRANTGCYGLTMQSVGPNDGHLKIHDNIYYGPLPGTSLSGQTTEGFASGNNNPNGTHNVEIYNNQISYTSNPAITLLGVDLGSIRGNVMSCTGGGISIQDRGQYITVENNRFDSPQQTVYTITSVTTTADKATTVYTGTFADGGSNALQNQIFNIAGFTNPLNNGTWGVSASTTTTLTLFNPAGVTESAAATGTTGCSSTLGRAQNNTQITETGSNVDYNIYKDNVGAGQIITLGAHSQIINTQAANLGTDGVSQTIQIPTGFQDAIPGGIKIGAITAPVLNTSGPTNVVTCTCTLTNGTYYYIVTAVAANGGEVPSNEVSILAGPAYGCAHLGWTYSAGAASYNIYRSTGSGTELLMTNVPQGTLGYADPGGQTPGAAVPVSDTTARIKFADGTTQITAPSGGGNVTNASPLTANLPVIGDDGAHGIKVGTVSGNTTEFATFTGAATAARCVDTDANGNLQVTGADCAAATPSVSTGYLIPPLTGATATALTPTDTQNQMFCMRFLAPFQLTATHFSYMPAQSAGASSHVGFAIYDTTGNSTRLMTTGALDGTLVGKQTRTVSSFTLVQGTAYLFCWTNDQASPGTWQTYGSAITTAVMANLINTTSTSNIVTGATASVAGAPPATLSTLTVKASGGGFPFAFVEP